MYFPFKKQLASFVSVAIMLTTVLPMRTHAQTAAPICYADSMTMEGRTVNCGAVTRGGQNLAFPKLAWSEVGAVQLEVSKNVDQLQLGKPSDNLASIAAESLGLEEKDVIQAVSTLPTNVPMVFARYSVWDASLTIDIFKVEKTAGTARMMHAAFTPEHGEIWRAAGAYATTANRQAGGLGRNPFEPFKEGTGRFANLSFNAAQVAVGHAQRLVQAPVSIMAMVNSNIRPTTHKKSCGLMKCVTTKYWLDMDTKWFVGVPPGQAHRSLSLLPSGYCLTAPSQAGAECGLSDGVTAGVAFVEQEGGTFMNEQVTEFIDQKTKKSLGLLAILAIVFVMAFAFSAIMTAMAAPSAGAGGAVVGTGAGTGVSAGGFLGSVLNTVGNLGGFATYGTAAAVETALTAGVLVGLGGADLNSTMELGAPAFLSSKTSAVAAPVNPNDQSDPIVQKGIRMTKPRTVGDLSQSIAPVRRTLVGDCGFMGKSESCGGNTQGIVQRADNLVSTSRLQLYREADGTPLENNK